MQKMNLFYEDKSVEEAIKMLGNGAVRSTFDQTTLVQYGTEEYAEFTKKTKKNPVKLIKVSHPKTGADTPVAIFMN